MVSREMRSSLDNLVQYVQLYKPVPTVLQGTVLPFMIIYLVQFYTWIFVYGFEEYYEAGFLLVALVAVFQILLCLSCYWSVHVQCILACTGVSPCDDSYLYSWILFRLDLALFSFPGFQVKDPIKAEVVKVVPTSNNGFSELVKLHHTKVLYWK